MTEADRHGLRDHAYVNCMLYGLVVLLVILAVALFLLDVAAGGGVVGVLALLLLIWVVMQAPKRV